MQKLLASHLRDADEVLHFSKRLETYTESLGPEGSVTLQFKDGTSACCDLLIGSDGIRSAVRRTMYTRLADETGGDTSEELRAMIEPVWSGWVVNRAVIPAEMLSAEAKQEASRPTIVSPPAAYAEELEADCKT